MILLPIYLQYIPIKLNQALRIFVSIHNQLLFSSRSNSKDIGIYQDEVSVLQMNLFLLSQLVPEAVLRNCFFILKMRENRKGVDVYAYLEMLESGNY